MATEQEKTDKELLGAFLRQRGIDESITPGREEYRQLGKGVARNIPLLAGLPADLKNALLKINPRTRQMTEDLPWFPEDPVGGSEYFAEKMGLEREGGGLEGLGEVLGGLINPAAALKPVGILGSKIGIPFIERQIEKLMKAGKMPKGATLATGAERKTLSEVLEEAQTTKRLAEFQKRDVGTPWEVLNMDEITDLQNVTDDYIKDARKTLYGGLDEVEGVLYNMNKVTDELMDADMIPLKGWTSHKPDVAPNPEILQEGQVYFYNRAHAKGDMKDLQGFKQNPDLGMDIVIGGKDGMADAVLNVSMQEGIENQFYVGSLRSNTPMGGQKMLKKIGPTLDKLGIEVHMTPAFMPNWRTQRQAVLTNHYKEIDKVQGGRVFSDKFNQQVSDYSKWLEKNVKSHTTEKLKNWYRRVGKFSPDEKTGTWVRKPDYSRYEKTLKEIPKKGLGGLIDKTNMLR